MESDHLGSNGEQIRIDYQVLHQHDSFADLRYLQAAAELWAVLFGTVCPQSHSVQTACLQKAFIEFQGTTSCTVRCNIVGMVSSLIFVPGIDIMHALFRRNDRQSRGHD